MSVTKLSDRKYLVDFTWTEAGKRRRLRRQFIGSSRKARELERKLKNEAKFGNPVLREPARERLLFKSFAWDWHKTYVKANNKHSEQETKRTYLRIHLIPFFGHMHLDEICKRDIEKFKATELREGAAPRSVNLYVACLRKALQCAVDWEFLESNPARGVLKIKDREEKWSFLDFEQSEKFMEAVPKEWKPVFLCALRTGMRKGEIIALRWVDIDWKRRTITARNSASSGVLTPTKSYKSRDIPIPRDLYEVLDDIKDNGSQFVFPARSKGILNARTLNRPLRTANANSGVKRIRFHDLRHTYASHLAISGAPIKAIQELLGHSDLKTTMRYAHLTAESKMAVVNQLEQALSGSQCAKNVTVRS